MPTRAPTGRADAAPAVQGSGSRAAPVVQTKYDSIGSIVLEDTESNEEDEMKERQGERMKTIIKNFLTSDRNSSSARRCRDLKDPYLDDNGFRCWRPAGMSTMFCTHVLLQVRQMQQPQKQYPLKSCI